MSKHKARFWEYIPTVLSPTVSRARAHFSLAVLNNDINKARQLRVRGRVGTTVRGWSDGLRPFWK